VDPVPDPLLLKESGSGGNRTRDLWVCSQELWPLDHRSGPDCKGRGLENKTEWSLKFLLLRQAKKAWTDSSGDASPFNTAIMGTVACICGRRSAHLSRLVQWQLKDTRQSISGWDEGNCWTDVTRKVRNWQTFVRFEVITQHVQLLVSYCSCCSYLADSCHHDSGGDTFLRNVGSNRIEGCHVVSATGPQGR
jgi:hypothetical protein